MSEIIVLLVVMFVGYEATPISATVHGSWKSCMDAKAAVERITPATIEFDAQCIHIRKVTAS